MEAVKTTIPPGLADDKIEFFVLNGEPVFLQGGKMHVFGDLSIDEATKLRSLLDHDKKAVMGLELLGIIDPIEQLKKFVFCRFGNFDLVPDIDEEEVHYEYWDCGCRSKCLAEGFLCLAPQVKNGNLTPHELKLIILVRSDITNKQIAELLHRSVHTINRECEQIAEKIGCFTKTGIAAFAGTNGI